MQTIDGTVTNIKNGETVAWSVKRSEEASQLHGMDGGHIIKMTMQQNGRRVFLYNRGQIEKASTPEAITTLSILMRAYN